MDRSHDVETDVERERLRSLVTRSSDAELSKPMPGGWTVAASSAHVGYWDARAIYFLDEWGPSGVIPPRTPAQLALRLADDADRRHRKEHLDDIARALRS